MDNSFGHSFGTIFPHLDPMVGLDFKILGCAIGILASGAAYWHPYVYH
jgi:hypothetical protein